MRAAVRETQDQALAKNNRYGTYFYRVCFIESTGHLQ